MTILTNNLHIKRHLSGIKLLQPDEKEANNENSLTKIMNFPVSVILLDHSSKILWINNQNASTLGFDSTHAALGKTIVCAYKDQSALFSLQHDHDVLKTRQLIIKEESCERVDNKAFHAITAKMPWYDQDDKIIGLAGYSLAVGLDNNKSIKDTLQSFLNLNLFENSHSTFPVSTLNNISFTKRELDLINYIVKGKTAREMSVIMNLSHRTIESYIECIKAKTGINKKSHLIEYFINGSNEPVPCSSNLKV
ncbi:MAG: helix-turn-helix transcriptional regulator [Legionella longbeachae]|nr:helix-turn-helix transcriptional regulator [Legionella longbeachae]